MKKLLLLTALLIAAFTVLAQLNAPSPENKKITLQQMAVEGSTIDWLKFKPDFNTNNTNLIQLYKSALNLSVNDDLRVYKVVEDALGFTHYRNQQYYKNLKVEGAEYIVHEKNGRAVSANGKLVNGLNLDVKPTISVKDAIENALNFVNAKKYLWQDAGAEAMLKQLENNANATFYPEAELVISQEDYNQNATDYRLCYKMEIMASEPVSRTLIFIDAKTAEVYHSLNLLHTTNDVSGIAQTKYNGLQTIVTDSVEPGKYRLAESGRGGGIQTLNLNSKTSFSTAADFFDDDNFWNNVNTTQDEAATDAHWAAEKTYDYFMERFGYSSFDGQGSKLINYVHYGNKYNNAFWNGKWMTYGDGDGQKFTPLTSVDIGAHEITHGITEFTAALIYQRESGALNESFSDIFGAAVEKFARPEKFNWIIGEDCTPGGSGIRSMLNPNIKGHPKNYRGKFWHTASSDNGGVHINSGVQNHWFYLLVEGENGMNDFERPYGVVGLGMDKAAEIAFRTLSVYLTQSSKFQDARIASLQSAEDLFGACSNEYFQVANAWAAVGLGEPVADYDLEAFALAAPQTSCALTNKESVAIQLRYNGCNKSLNIGDSIPVAYSLNGSDTIQDTIVLTSPVNAGDTIRFTFKQPADFSTIGKHTIVFWSNSAKDPNIFNNKATVEIENKIRQNVDIGAVALISPTEYCGLSNAEPVTVQMQFFGCDSLAAGQTIAVAYQLNGGAAVKDSFVLQNSIYPNQLFSHTFSVPANVSAQLNHSFNIWTEYSKDIYTANNRINSIRIKNTHSIADKIISFENMRVLDSMKIHTNKNSKASVSIVSASTGVRSMQMSGGDPLNFDGEMVWPDLFNHWEINEDFSSKICFCVNAENWQTANLRFDLKQTFSGIYKLHLGEDLNYASSLRLLVNNNHIGGTYIPEKVKTDPFKTHYVNLDAFAGTNFEMCFEARNLMSSTVDPSGNGDNAFIDNIYVSEMNTNSIQEPLNLSKMQFFPNPNNGNFTITFDAIQPEKVSFNMVDVLGRTVIQTNTYVANGQNTFNINAATTAKGVYMLQIKTEKEIHTERIVIK